MFAPEPTPTSRTRQHIVIDGVRYILTQLVHMEAMADTIDYPETVGWALGYIGRDHRYAAYYGGVR